VPCVCSGVCRVTHAAISGAGGVAAAVNSDVATAAVTGPSYSGQTLGTTSCRTSASCVRATVRRGTFKLSLVIVFKETSSYRALSSSYDPSKRVTCQQQ